MSKRHTCKPVVDESEEYYDPRVSDDWVIVSQTYVCEVCGRPMDGPDVQLDLLSRITEAFGKL